jgi:hypothetical protein
MIHLKVTHPEWGPTPMCGRSSWEGLTDDPRKNECWECESLVSGIDYAPGDLITYRNHLDQSVRCIVLERHANIKNGQPGFDAITDESREEQVWGYDSQITSVIHRSESGLRIWDRSGL